MRRLEACVPALAVTAILLSLAPPAEAIPRYSARYRQNCNLCHENPTGGGLRSLYASQFLIPTEMVIRSFDAEKIERIQPQVSESITLGADFRTIHHQSDEDRPLPERNFFQMQGDVYIQFRADERISLYLDRGQTRSEELFGLAYVLPAHGYVKIGRFQPDFGWKFDDHRQFVRTLLFFEPPATTDVGIELGAYPGRFELHVAALNGERGSTSDSNEILGFVGRAGYRFDVGPAGCAVGGSYWRNSEAGGRRLAAGPFWYVDIGRLTWLGEVDWSNLDPRLPASPNRTALVTSHELSLQLVRGLDLRAIYDFFDPDLDRKTGIQVRLGGGVDALMTPFVGFQGMLHWYRNDHGLDVTGVDYLQSELMLHFFY